MTNKCYLCQGKEFLKRAGKVRDMNNLRVLECMSCGLVFLSSFSHISKGFYESGLMHNGEPGMDVAAWLKETEWDDIRRFHSYRRIMENKSILDFGCGAGGFLSRSKYVVSEAIGIELEKGLKNYFRDKGLSVFSSLDEVAGKMDLIFLFHVLEHIANPISLLRKLSKKLKAGGHIIIEVPNANDAMLTIYKCEAFSNFTYWSCHLFLFTGATLIRLAKRAGLRIDYIKHIQRYPLSNHLYWLSKSKPNGHKEWGFLDSSELTENYEKQLASIGCSDTIVASFSNL